MSSNAHGNTPTRSVIELSTDLLLGEAGGHRGCLARGHAVDTLAVVHVITPGLGAWVGHDDVVENDVGHRVRGVAEDDTGTLLGIVNVNITQDNVGPSLVTRHMALSIIRDGPEKRARLASLLGRTHPDGVLLRIVHRDVLVQNITDRSHLADRSLVVPTSLHVDTLESVGQITVAEGDVLDDRATNGTNDQAETTARDALEQHVTRAILHGNAVILIPDGGVVNVDILAGDVEAVGVEGLKVNESVAVSIRPASIDIGMANQKAVAILGVESPVRTVLE